MKMLVAALLVAPAFAYAQPPGGDGVPFPPAAAAPPAVVGAARAALATELYGAAPPMTAVRLDLGRQALLVTAESGAVCGNSVGCPTAIMVRDGNRWKAVWTGMAFGRGSVLPTRHSGLRDVALAMSRGQSLLSFDGVSYVEAPAR